jgi:hypothetical protein
MRLIAKPNILFKKLVNNPSAAANVQAVNRKTL